MSAPYVYRLTDRLTGKRYIGSRYGKGCSPADLGVSYFTSRPEVAALFKADPMRFDRQILVTGTVEYVIAVEKSLLDLYDAVRSEEFYNRSCGRAIHPDDVRAGALKEHAKRSPELYKSIAQKMHAKVTKEQRRKAALSAYARMTPEQQAAKMQAMRDSKTAESNAKTREASIQRALQNPGRMSDMGKQGGKVGGPRACKLTNAQSWRCKACGLVTKPGPLGKHQSRSGHSGKERVK